MSANLFLGGNMRVEITVVVSESNSRYGDPEVKKEIIIDVPGTNFESLNLPGYIQTTLEESITEFAQLPPEKEEPADVN